ncbi:MAG: crossover junction endodeoxyribonuclease RuvC [Candidatus Cyclonatronum sp.]|uniref:crossover junction endodeoxyribonuclease RuvC n=1 Tax=Cyclonatronum sp. TaxID=3024185 RepID=UPI0025BF952B|nr:crossover junction endodeoxyribonuclease RuvC [Cyclonatronum sp.]MCC5932653.1 crossover junction endodeoxyribonuclease RuvC [Balneolales bacterium]MCH8486037.1 crossover junction endodeoxyribonuclease RuvC [Cyclonatronum sp.]
MEAEIFLGIDPGSRRTGYAVLSRSGTRFEALALGVLRAEQFEEHARRLQFIFEEIQGLMQQYKPHFCAIETPVYGKDPLAMLKLGRAQAACILALSAGGLEVAEYYPKAVKKSITGNGNAAKEQVAYMLAKLLNLGEEAYPADATDALAVAWCHAMRKDMPGDGHPLKRQGRGHSAWGDFLSGNPDRIIRS